MAPPELPGVRVEARRRVGRLTLCRPERRNALGYPQLQALVDAAAWFDAQPDVGVVVVAGEGPSFCGGFDVRDPGPPPPGGAEVALDLGRVAMNAVGSMRAVTVARVHGTVKGGGTVLALTCDLAVAALDTRLSLPESHMGMPIPWATLPRLVRLLGPMRAKELVLLAVELGGFEAAEAGLVTRVVPPAYLDSAVASVVDSLLASPNLVLHEVAAEIERLAEGMAPTTDGAGDVDRMKRAHRDPGCQRAGEAYLAAWEARRSGSG
ncbi:enoyl-CoA hydratase/isomerase family protein [Iamia majanohamensis]|uniref:Enoyl-CoA hydratase/isomerase family protein n=1 Tax=Iamia majanohamensis TaxID=467976 RepID=A0AAF0BXN9_9ACTN|nr:enoyl-CoA hydratase/isomerase family protein [Iamia majanohamensis]WCO68964.1 enoyl-CoA hydratase/isomerase family protein [Iamia majanohamensis]